MVLRGKGLSKVVGKADTPSRGSEAHEIDLHQQKRDNALSIVVSFIRDECRSSVLTIHDPTKVGRRLKDIYQTMSEDSIGAKLVNLQNVRI